MIEFDDIGKAIDGLVPYFASNHPSDVRVKAFRAEMALRELQCAMLAEDVKRGTQEIERLRKEIDGLTVKK